MHPWRQYRVGLKELVAEQHKFHQLLDIAKKAIAYRKAVDQLESLYGVLEGLYGVRWMGPIPEGDDPTLDQRLKDYSSAEDDLFKTVDRYLAK